MRRTLAPVALLDALDGVACAALRARFLEVGYGDAILSRAEEVGRAISDRMRLPLLHRWLEREGSPAADLLRLFVYGAALPEGRVREIVGGDLQAALARAGVLVGASGEDAGPGAPPPEGDAVRSAYLLAPFDGLWILSDEPWAGREAAVGPAMTTLVLHALLPPAVRGAFLDVGCGAGTFALVAARRGAAPAVGVDISERAVRVARVNARLNDVLAEFRAGDGLEPVRGTEFDIAVCQPPYVVAPPGRERTTYLHGGEWGDELALRLAGEIAGGLAPGGRALLFFDSPARPGPALHARLREALGGRSVDLLVLVAKALSPDFQAAGYACVENPDLGPDYDEAARRYRDHFEAMGIGEVRHALVAIVRSAGAAPPGGRFTFSVPVRRVSGLSAGAFERFLGAVEAAAGEEGALRRARVRFAPGARIAIEREGPAPDAVTTLSVRFADGAIGNDTEISERTYALLEALHAAPSVLEAVPAYAEALGAAPDEVLPEVLRFAREGLARGILVVGD